MPLSTAPVGQCPSALLPQFPTCVRRSSPPGPVAGATLRCRCRCRCRCRAGPSRGGRRRWCPPRAGLARRSPRAPTVPSGAVRAWNAAGPARRHRPFPKRTRGMRLGCKGASRSGCSPYSPVTGPWAPRLLSEPDGQETWRPLGSFRSSKLFLSGCFH